VPEGLSAEMDPHLRSSDVHGPASSHGPKSQPDHSFGLARDSGKPKLSAQAAAFE
jgi:hypothetical protein